MFLIWAIRGAHATDIATTVVVRSSVYNTLITVMTC